MSVARLFATFLLGCWVSSSALASVCEGKPKEGVYGRTFKAQTGLLATASVGIKGGEATRSAPFLDAAEIKAKLALESGVKSRLGLIADQPQELYGVVVVSRCVINGREYASVWVSEASIKSSAAVKQALKDSLDENPTPKARMSPSMLDEDFSQFPQTSTKVQID